MPNDYGHVPDDRRTGASHEDDERNICELLEALGLLSAVSQDASGAEFRDVHPDALLQRARDIFIHRRKRLAIFGQTFFGEPAWEMLLVLYVAQRSHRCTTGQLARLSGAATSSAFRWIDALSGQGLVEKLRHPTDRRLSFIRLSAKGRAAVELYLSETMPAGD